MILGPNSGRGRAAQPLVRLFGLEAVAVYDSYVNWPRSGLRITRQTSPDFNKAIDICQTKVWLGGRALASSMAKRRWLW
jgi:hypothetical protein